VNERRPEDKSMAVPTGAKQIEEAPDRWSWVEPSVWSERMLQTLATGIKGGANAFFEHLGHYNLAEVRGAMRSLRF